MHCLQLTSVRSKVGFAALSRMSRYPPAEFAEHSVLTVHERPVPKYTFTVRKGGEAVTQQAAKQLQQRMPGGLDASMARELVLMTGQAAMASGYNGMDGATRVLELRSMNLFDCTDAWESDIVICETNIDRVRRA